MTEDSVVKREKSSLLTKTSEEKEIKVAQKKIRIDTPCESNIKTVVEECISLKNEHFIGR